MTRYRAAVPSATASDGATIAYEITGAGPDLVLIHGITESRHAWDPLVPAFAMDHRVIAIDLRGHGESARRPPYDAFTMADDVQTVIDHASARDVVVVGHSLGGMVATLHAAAHEPRATVNVDQPLEISGFGAALEQLAPMLRGDDASFQAAMHAVMETLYPPLAVEERARLQALASPEQDVVLGVWDIIMTTPPDSLDALVRDTARDITAPYLALLGSDVDASYDTWLRERIASATIERWPGDGHYPHLVEPERFVARVNTFAASA